MRNQRRLLSLLLLGFCVFDSSQAFGISPPHTASHCYARAQRVAVTMGVNPPSVSKGEVDVVKLLGCCVCACERAASVIRAVEKQRRSSTTGAIEGAVLKDANDLRSYLTEADTAAQKVIMQTLRGAFPTVMIIGEEEEEEQGEQGAMGTSPFDDANLRQIMSRVENEFSEAPAEVRTASVEDVCVFVDPVDGTKEFVEGRLGAVQTLIGISVRGHSVAGAVGIPFLEPYDGDAASPAAAHVMYAIAQLGAKNIPAPTGQRPADGGGVVLVASPSGREAALTVAKTSLQPHTIITPGGVGNKILSVLRGDADCALMHLSTSLWDTCAPEALLRAQGGHMTSLLGERIDHSAGARILNIQGVFVTSNEFPSKDKQGRTHAQLCNEWTAAGILNAPPSS